MEGTVSGWRFSNLLLLGLLVGLIFGSADLIFTWRHPLEDDTAGVLLRFYGPIFLVWVAASCRVARHTGRLPSGVTAGIAVAFATFCVFVVLSLLRVNLFLDQLAGRADWQNLMARSRTSGFESLRLFVNLDYIKGTPLKNGAASAIGAMIGAIGGSLAGLARARTIVKRRG